MPAPTRHSEPLGFRVWRRTPHGSMPAAHAHPDLELNFLFSGAVTYLHGGSTHRVEAGRLVAFWGGVPHQTLAPGITGEGIWITLPLAWFLAWRLPNGLPDRLLQGELVQEVTAPAQLERWLRDFQSHEAERRRALLLELEAWLLRVALTSPAKKRPRATDARGTSQIDRIMNFVAAHYQETLTVADIAGAVKLHPKYLMRLFKRHCRIGVWEYLTRLRISHAQRLLVTSDARVTDIALESGFGSPAAFYQAFAAHAHGEKPLDYRRRLRPA